MPIMLVTTGPQRGRVIRWLRGDAQLIGRTDGAAVQLDDPKIAPRHAELVQKAGQWFIRDLGSDAGTFVNLVRIKDFMRLCDGDQIIVGDSVLAYCSAGGVDDVPDAPQPVDLTDQGSESSTEWSAKSAAHAAAEHEPASSGPEDTDADWLAALSDVAPWSEDDAADEDVDAPGSTGDHRDTTSADRPSQSKEGEHEQAADMGDPHAQTSEGPEEVFDAWSAALESAISDPHERRESGRG